MTEFKAGDFISPVCDTYPAWHNIEILSYNAIERNATVKYKDGRILEDFNLDPACGVPFKVVGDAS